MIGKTFCKTVHIIAIDILRYIHCIDTLYCNNNKNLNRVRAAEKRGKPQSVLGWFPPLKDRVVHNKRPQF